MSAPVIATFLIKASAILTASMIVAVLVERTFIALRDYRARYLSHRYNPLIAAALNGDPSAIDALKATPPRHRFALGMLLGLPLIDDRDPDRIAKTRALFDAMLWDLTDWYLHSPLWWRRALAVRALGLIQDTAHSNLIVAALDDDHPDVRAAALDALADLHNPATLPAIVARLNDSTLHRGRRAVALSSFGAAAEPFLIDFGSIDAAQRANYARGLGVCGTDRSRPVLCEWAADQRADVRAAALNALARIGLDTSAVPIVVAALDDADVQARSAAAHALLGWEGDDAIAARLSTHLDDDWPVAWRAARSLRSMGAAGRAALEARAARTRDLGGLLARQMLWQEPRP